MKANCCYCGNEFERKQSLLKRAKNPTCSQECRDAMYKEKGKDKWEIEKCCICGKKMQTLKSLTRGRQNPCCSKECKSKLLSNLNSKPKIEVSCLQCGKYFEVFPYRLKGDKVVTCSRSCSYYYQFSHDKSKHPRYNSNITDKERVDKRKTQENIIWRNSVLARDNYTCDICGQYGGKLNAHHKNGFHWCKEQRFDINNGVTLCKSCHDDFHSIYGKQNNNETQYIEYANLNRRLVKD